MNSQELINTAKLLVADDKGLLAMDKSNSTCNKRFAKQGIPQAEETRRDYRELIITTPRLGECISGAILYDETIRQRKKDGTPFIKVIIDAGIVPGIKVDTGAKDLAGHPGETITEGLDGLRGRLDEYFQMGARFAKWRAVIAIRPRNSQSGLHRGQCAGVGPLCRVVPGRSRFRLPAPFNSRLLRYGKARRLTWRQRSKLFFIEPGVTGLHGVANMKRPWKKHGSGTPLRLRHSRPRNVSIRA